MRYCNIPSDIFRNKFDFEFLPDFDGSIWKQVKNKADTSIRELPQGLIAGSDLAEEAVNAPRINIMGLHYTKKNVRVERADFRELPAIEGQVIVANPPYCIRVGGDEDIEAFYKNLGDFLKQMIASRLELEKAKSLSKVPPCINMHFISMGTNVLPRSIIISTSCTAKSRISPLIPRKATTCDFSMALNWGVQNNYETFPGF